MSQAREIKKIFGINLQEIKKHPLFINLKLKEDEILKNQQEINSVLNSAKVCGDEQKFCKSIEPHYMIKRNQDGRLILREYECKKTKDYKRISEEALNKSIKKHIKNSDYLFSSEEFFEILKKFKTYTKDEKIIENIGNKNYLLGNKYILENRQDIHLLYLMHASLINLEVQIINSQFLKDIFWKKQFNNFEENNYANELQKQYWDIPFLIILNLGLEYDHRKNFYYLDALPEFLNYRKNHKYHTYIITPVPWKIIMKNIQENNYYQKQTSETSKLIQEIKMKSLDDIMSSLFEKSNI